MRIIWLSAALLSATVPVSAQAQDQVNPYGYDKIAARDLNAAEMRLIAQSKAEPDEPSVLINLAYVYARTGRVAMAQTLYDRVLAQPDVLMALGNGKPASSHAIALKASGRSVDLAAR